jgi:error-prone DNA polymerase
MSAAAYAELQVTSNFSFLRGASHPEELVKAAALLGHRAIAITDRNSVAGIVRAHAIAKEVGLRLVIGVRLDFDDAPSVLCFPRDRAAYARLTTLLTLGKRRAEKGQCLLHGADLFDHAEGQIAAVLPPERPDRDFAAQLQRFAERLEKTYLAAHHLYRGDDARRLTELGELADRLGVPLVVTNDVHYHAPERRPLQDVITCVREGCTIHDAGWRLFANAERHLKPAEEMAQLFASRPDALARTLEVVDATTFSLDELRYEYPAEPVPDGRTPQQELERLTWIGADWRYPRGVPDSVRAQIVHELALIAELKFAPYFLTVCDLVRFARQEKILHQGRGSAANSAVCFVLGITAVDPSRMDGGLLFERFVSTERNEPPDIDVDFEHERREEVIQYIYKKYGRERAGIAATVISYRSKSALRDVGKAMGMSQDTLNILAKSVCGWDETQLQENYFRETGLDPSDRTLRQVVALTQQLIGFPRHLSQHVGGFVITKGPLHELVPIENAAMEDRTVIEWDKDDLDSVGLLKIDVLALGMLTCLRKGFAMMQRHYGKTLTLESVPPKDVPTFDMLCRADSIGVFQVESRAQMSMLPRLKPRRFYDLVIEVAIVRPGPIQGGMVHPYLRRREGKEPEIYPSPELQAVLGRTLGVPLFQEQAMQIAIVAAGFTPAEADKLRRAMATFRRSGSIDTFRKRFIAGMLRNNYQLDFAQRCFKEIEGFADYGFPESHAASFALLVYNSAWLKCHYPAVFAAALLNSQPMGFYAPAQIVRDARDHGVEVRPVDVNHSDWDCTLEPAANGLAMRLGLRQVKGVAEADAKKLVEARGAGFASLREAWRRSGLKKAALEKLANADAWASLGLSRRDALWQIRGLSDEVLPLFSESESRLRFGHNGPPADWTAEPVVTLPAMSLGEQVIEDYRHLHFSLRRHPVAFLRPRLMAEGIVPCARLAELRDGDTVTVAGLVLVRQQPGTAKGVIFSTLEDETGIANIIVWPDTYKRFRRTLLDSRLLAVTGKLQKAGIVVHVIASRLVNRSDDLRVLSDADGTFEQAMARADQVRRSSHDPREVMPAGRNFR